MGYEWTPTTYHIFLKKWCTLNIILVNLWLLEKVKCAFVVIKESTVITSERVTGNHHSGGWQSIMIIDVAALALHMLKELKRWEDLYYNFITNITNMRQKNFFKK